jgi:Mg2+/citrate symporter
VFASGRKCHLACMLVFAVLLILVQASMGLFIPIVDYISFTVVADAVPVARS